MPTPVPARRLTRVSSASTTTTVDVARLRRRVRTVLITGQVLAGLGMGSTLSVGALLFADLAGPAFSGMAATMSTIGAALAAVPLAMLANRKGRAPALATGALIAGGGAAVGIVAAVLAFAPLLFLAIAMVGVGTAVNLQSRFAATDLSEPRTRGRDLSLVVWATTIGAVSGPNLIAPGDAFGQSIGLPEYAGPFILTIGAQVAAAIVYLVGLRPDPCASPPTCRLRRRGSRCGCRHPHARPRRRAHGHGLDRTEPRDDGCRHGDDAGAPHRARSDARDRGHHHQPARRWDVRARRPCSASCPTGSAGCRRSRSGRRCCSPACSRPRSGRSRRLRSSWGSCCSDSGGVPRPWLAPHSSPSPPIRCGARARRDAPTCS